MADTRERAERVLEREDISWQDLVIFLMDDFLIDLLDNMNEECALDITEDEAYDLKKLVEFKVRAAIGRPE